MADADQNLLHSADGVERPDSYALFYPPGSDADLRFRLMRRMVVGARRWRVRVDQAMQEGGQSQARWEALLCLAAHPDGLTQGELARLVSVEDPTVARMLAALERDGLIHRAVGAADRRKRIVRISEAGRIAFEAMQATTDRLRDDLLAGLDGAELRHGLRLLDRILARLDG
ncbi:MAG: MarR family transcriptional regulator [Sphingomonas fennica]